MKDPQRLSMEEESSELARSLLAAGRARREPEGARERVWGALTVGVAGGVVTGAAASAGGAGVSASGASAKGAGFALALTKAKLLVIGGVATVASVTVVAIERNEPPMTAKVAPAMPASAMGRETREPKASARKASATAEPEPKSEPSVEEPPKTAAQKATTVPAHVIGRAPVKDETTSVSLLREEAALLHEVRAALARGDLGAARTKLDDARARFPKSQLAPERDALEVRLASASGDHGRAATLARDFVEHYPDSPLRAGIESSARAPEKE